MLEDHSYYYKTSKYSLIILANQSGDFLLQLKIQELEKEKTELQDKLKELEGMCVVRVLTILCLFCLLNVSDLFNNINILLIHYSQKGGS